MELEMGIGLLALIVFLEYLNLPGFPAGVILPAAGAWVATTDMSFAGALAISVAAAVVASCILYGIGWYGGKPLLDRYLKKHPKQNAYVEKKLDYLREKGNRGVFISKLIPVARTIIGLPAGVLGLHFWQYTAYSALGIVIWNGVLMYSGYIVVSQVI